MVSDKGLSARVCWGWVAPSLQARGWSLPKSSTQLQVKSVPAWLSPRQHCRHLCFPKEEKRALWEELVARFLREQHSFL